MYAWYAIYTKANGEKRISMNLKEDNIECYLPLKKTLRQWSDRKKWIEEPLFRCYLFVRVSHIEFFNVLNMPGVVSYVSFGGQPQSIPDQQIENIKKLVEQQEREVILSRENLEKGQNAEVLLGPFKGMQGEVVKICGNYRIVIRIETLGCSLYANVSRDEIQVLRRKRFDSQNIKHTKSPNYRKKRTIYADSLS
ncbi:UpxY family transcription antiterminator [Mariniphaga sediminis]